MLKVRILKIIDRLVGVGLVHLLPAPQVDPYQEPCRVLFIRPGGIGDAVLLIPAINALKRNFPGISISVLAEKRNAAVLSLCEAVDCTYCYDCFRDLVKVLRDSYNAIVDTEQWHRLSAVLARLIGAPMLVGFATNQRKRLYTHSISYSHDEHEIDSFFSLLEPFGILTEHASNSLYLSVPARDAGSAAEKLEVLADSPFVALFPGASIPEKRWGSAKFRELALRIRGHGLRVVVVGGKGEAEAGAAIAGGGVACNLAGCTSLAETAAVLARSCLLVTGDSGVLHMAAALGIPTVSLFGPGIARKWAPRGECHIVLNRHLHCSPCTRFGHTPRCSEGARCLAEIGIDEVEKTVIELLRKNPFCKISEQEQIS